MSILLFLSLFHHYILHIYKWAWNGVRCFRVRGIFEQLFHLPDREHICSLLILYLFLLNRKHKYDKLYFLLRGSN